jgi:molybdate transport system permease protein
VPSDVPFFTVLILLGGSYVLMILAMLVADASFTTPMHLVRALDSPEIRYSIRLSLISCTITTILSLWVAVPIGYLMSRRRFPGRNTIDAVLDIPIVLPPLVIGISLLILFQTAPGRVIEGAFDSLYDRGWWPWRGITYEVPSIVLAQFMVACAFAVRTIRVTFDQIDPRAESVALTLGCSRSQAFWRVVLPEARRGMLTAATLAWARSLGEFGPILVFSGATRMRTEVLPTTVFLELSIGNLEGAVAVSLIMVIAAVAVLIVARVFGLREPSLL